MKPDLQVIRERADRSTDGPWINCDEQVGEEHYCGIIRSTNDCVCYDGVNYCDVVHPTGGVLTDEDADFIANARTDIPSLLDYIERLEMVNRWIPIGEKFPEHDQRVDIWVRDEEFGDDRIADVTYDHENRLFTDDLGGECDLLDEYAPAKVTHWMPLPEQPTDNMDGDV